LANLDHSPEAEFPPPPRRITVEEYVSLAEAGTFGAGEHVQLIHGEIVRTTQMGNQHRRVMAIISALLNQRFMPSNAVVVSQLPIEAGSDSMPEPDFMVYDRGFVGPDLFPKGSDLLLAIEVADTSIKLDRGAKAALYARAGIREYWIVNLTTRHVEVHRRPDAAKESYEEIFTRKVGERLSLRSHPKVQFAVGDFFGDNDVKLA
jgi:Uma2 family endonuclease